MTLINRVFPQPIMTAAIAGLWAILEPDPGRGYLLLGVVLGIIIPWMTHGFWPGRPRIVRRWAGLRLFALVLFDILAANWHVARLVLGPTKRLRPTFVTVPLNISDPFVASLLGSIVSLTPGTVSIEIDMREKTLFIHALDVDDEAALIASIKSRYETPLKEIFGC